MALEKISEVSGRAVYVQGNDLDTDRIIPARFLRCVTFDGLGEQLFYDVRFDETGKSLNHSLDDPRFAGATVLISNSNFGCGSSREHAPQAIAKAGFRAVIAESFAEIFFGNSTTLGIPSVSLSGEDVRALATAVEADPTVEVTVDLNASEVRAGDSRFPFTIKPAAREALVAGQWDPIGSLLESREAVAKLDASLPY